MTTRQGTERRASLPPSVVVGWLCLVWAVVAVPVIRTSGLRPLVVVPTTLVLPGYSVTAVVFGTGSDDGTALGPVERFVVSVALSAAVAMALGVALAVTVGVSATTALAGLTVLTLGCTFLADGQSDSGGFAVGGFTHPGRSVRSLRTTLADRESALWRPSATLRGVRTVLPELPSTSEKVGVSAVAIAGLVVLCGLAGTGAAAYLLVGHDAPGYTEFSVVPAAGQATDTPGRAAPASLDDRFERGDTLRIRLHNERSKPTEYEVVALAQRAEPGDGVAVLASRTLDRFAVELGPGETWHHRHRPTVPWSNGSVRVVYRLFRGDAETSIATVHRWATVAAGGEANGTADPRVAPAGGEHS